MVSRAAGSSPHILAGHGEVSFLWWKAFLTPLMNRFHIALWCSWRLEGVGLFLGASEGTSLWLPCTPLCCWLGCPHLLGNKSEAKKSNLGRNQVKRNRTEPMEGEITKGTVGKRYEQGANQAASQITQPRKYQK